MDIRKPMTAFEKRMFKEAVIKEYKKKYEPSKKNSAFNDFVENMKKYTPVGIVCGIAASILIIVIRGWGVFFQIILSWVMGMTIISAFFSAISKKKEKKKEKS